MKKQNRFLTLAVAGLLAWSGTDNTYAQSGPATPAAYEMYQATGLWMRSRNSAGLMLDDYRVYTHLDAGYRYTGGEFRRPQQGKYENQLFIGVEGAAALPDLYAWGRFAHERNYEQQVRFNASIIDPYRGMPYYLVDAYPSQWEKHSYDMNFRMATRELGKRLRLGVEGRYVAQAGGKQNDFHSDNRYLFLQLRPGVVVSPADKHHIGLNFDYYAVKEEAETNLVYNNDAYGFYYNLGLGMGTYNRTLQRFTNFKGNSVGGAVQYNFQGDKFRLLAEGSYAYRVEDAFMRFTEPRPDGSVKVADWQAAARLFTLGVNRHQFEVRYSDCDLKGIQYLTEPRKDGEATYYDVIYSSIRLIDRSRRFELNYDLFLQGGSEYRWKLSAAVRYGRDKVNYILPDSRMRLENWLFSGTVKRNMVLPSALARRILLALEGGYNYNPAYLFDYNGPNTLDDAVLELAVTDYKYLRSRYHYLGGSVTYSQRIREELRANLFAKAEYCYTEALHKGSAVREQFRVSLGCNF